MYEYTVQEATLATPTTLSLKLKAALGAKPFAFLPGQYAGISFYSRGRRTAVRCFSIASSPTQLGELEFGIRVSGKYTRRLAQLKPGEKVFVQGPYGGFVFNAASQPTVVLVAGGIGITPMLSMLRFATLTQQTNKISLIYSIRSQDDAAYIENVRRIAARNPYVSIFFVVGEGPTSQLPGHVFQGRISPELIRMVCPGTLDETTFFICGPPPFMKSAVQIVRDQGALEPKIITEAFSQSHGRQTSKARGWPFNIYVMGTLGTAAASVALLTNDLLKSITPTLLPTKLSVKQNGQAGLSSRQDDLDRLINGLSPVPSVSGPSDAVVAANQEVMDAQAKIAEVNARNAAAATGKPDAAPVKKTITTTPSTSSGTTGSTATAPAPSPSPSPTPTPNPVCTTSPSGTVTCN